MTPAIGNLHFPDTTIHRVLDSLLSKGLCSGTGRADAIGTYCIMQAINLAENGLTPAKGIRTVTDEATCVADRPRRFAIRLNDRRWSSEEARALGLRGLGHALIGSAGIDQQLWVEALGRRYIVELLPTILAALSTLKFYAPESKSFLSAARRCQEEGTREAARFARDIVHAARSAAEARPNRYKPAVVAAVGAVEAAVEAAAEAVVEAVAEAVAVVAAVAEAAAAAAAVAAAAVVEAVAEAVAEAAVAVAEAGKKDAYWNKYLEIRDGVSPERDQMLTRVATIAAEELEIAKSARDAA